MTLKQEDTESRSPKSIGLGMNKVSRNFAHLVFKWIIFLIILVCIPLFTNNYYQYVINMIFTYVLLTFGLNIILGYCGQFSFAHAGFYGIGAYACGFLINRVGIPFWFSLPLGGVAGALGAFILSFPARRLERYWLAIITMTFTEIVVWVSSHWTAVTGGVSGMIVRRPSLFGLVIDSDYKAYYVNLVVCILMMIAGWRIISSKIGRAFVSVRDGQLAAQCLGVDYSKYKLMAYVISGFYAGISGGLLVLNLELIIPTQFDLYQMGIQFSMVMIGGIGTFFGSIAGAIFLTILPEILRKSQAYQEMFFGFFLLFVLIFMPKGLEGSIRKIKLLPREKLHIGQ